MKESSGSLDAQPRLLRSAGRAARAAIMALIAVPALFGSATLAAAETDRSLKLFFTHTGERATVTFKRDGRFDPGGLAKINRFLRDWRKNEPAKMDPRLLDLVWEVYDRSGATDYIHIVSAYRSPATNNMLRGRSRSTGVAKNSQHTLGKAMDFFIPGVRLATLRSLAMQAQVGGVGFYPTSGSPFVHLDVGNVRAWPRMDRQELARIFPNGKTMHLPSNGGPLPGYEQAVADYRKRVGPRSIEIAATAGDDDDKAPSSSRRNSLLTAMIPTQSNRSQEALQLQTDERTRQSGANQEFIDLAAMAIPVPNVRPMGVADMAAVETAALGPIAELATASVVRPASIIELREPAASIALLPIPLSKMDPDPDEEADAQDAVMDWALSAPSATTGLTAPMFAFRMLMDGNGRGDVMPQPVAEAFDHGRFSSDG